MARKGNAAREMFAAKGAGEVYSAIVSRLQKHLGAAQAVEDVKQTCVHVTAGEGGTAFAGLHPRKNAMLLNIRLDAPLKSARPQSRTGLAQPLPLRDDPLVVSRCGC